MRAGRLEPKRLLAGLFEGIIMLGRVVWSMDVLCWSMKQMAVSTVKDMTRLEIAGSIDRCMPLMSKRGTQHSGAHTKQQP
jgi:hypothetical protein